jgi:hypothetical protein
MKLDFKKVKDCLKEANYGVDLVHIFIQEKTTKKGYSIIIESMEELEGDFWIFSQGESEDDKEGLNDKSVNLKTVEEDYDIISYYAGSKKIYE